MDQIGLPLGMGSFGEFFGFCVFLAFDFSGFFLFGIKVVESMDSDYGIPRELSDLQKIRSLYQPELPPCLQVLTDFRSCVFQWLCEH